MVETAAAPAATAPIRPHGDAPVLELVGVGHEYGSGTPWATTALRDINFVVHEGDGVLIHGLNGSGKSTLAWIMAGLTVPTSGSCLLDGAPVSDQVGAVAISFQAARLQLMRSRVDLEVASAAGFSAARPRPGGGGTGHRRPGRRAGRATDRPAQRRADAPRGAGRAAGALTARTDPRRAAGRAGRRQPARTAAAAGGSAAQRRADGRRHLARLLRAGRAVPAHPAPAATACWRPRRRRQEACHDRARPRPQRRPVVLLRPVPGRTVIHDLWAGTKLIVVAGIGVLLTFYPGWVPIGVVAALVLAAARLAHIPRGALAVDPALAVVAAAARRRHGRVRRRQSRHRLGAAGRRPRRTAQVPADHARCRSCCSALGGDGVVDHQRRRDRARRSEIGPAAAAVADPGRRLGGGAGAGAARLPDADRRVPGAVRGPQAAAQAAAHAPAGTPAPVGRRGRRPAGGGDHRGAAPRRRDGRRDHRARRRRPDLCACRRGPKWP